MSPLTIADLESLQHSSYSLDKGVSLTSEGNWPTLTTDIFCAIQAIEDHKKDHDKLSGEGRETASSSTYFKRFKPVIIRLKELNQTALKTQNIFMKLFNFFREIFLIGTTADRKLDSLLKFYEREEGTSQTHEFKGNIFSTLWDRISSYCKRPEQNTELTPVV